MKTSGKPEWIRSKICGGTSFAHTDKILKAHNLHTVCRSALCPNRAECWENKTATFMILGEICTRSCRFCGVLRGAPLPPDKNEQARVVDAIKKMGLKYAVITSVTRDDLPDGGAGHWAKLVREIKNNLPSVKVEILTPDFQGKDELLKIVFESAPDVFAHNLETVKRLQKEIRRQANYETSLKVLKASADAGLRTKSGLMLGLGEDEEDLKEALADLKAAGVSVLTLGQYMRPDKDKIPVARWVTPKEFDEWKNYALGLGFASVFSAPLVRSSYNAHLA